MKKTLNKFLDFSNSWTGTIIIVLLVVFFIAQAFVIPSGSMKNTLLVRDFLFAKKFSYGICIPRIPYINTPILPDFFGNGHLIEGERPKRGDIVIFIPPHEKDTYFVKRNFAVGNDEVIFTEKAFYLRPHEGDEFIKANFDEKDIINIGGKNFVREPYKFGGIHYNEKVNLFDKSVMALNAGKFAMQPVIAKELPQVGDYPFNAFYFKVPEDEFFMIGDNRDDSGDSRFWGSVPYRDIVGQPWFVYLSFDDEYKIRWERIGKSVSELENSDKIIKSAYEEENHKK
ncbi:MAG: signal peptidase I [Campylobacter sp.]